MLHRLRKQERVTDTGTEHGLLIGEKIHHVNKQGIPDEKEVWKKFTAGDEEAFIEIYETYFEELCHFGLQYISLPQVEDCIQDMFIHLRQKRDKLPEIRNSIRLFLFQCLKRRILNIRKKYSGEDVFHEPFEIVLPHDTLIIFHQEQKERMKKLDKALRSLDPKQREAVYYYFYKGMGYEEVQKLMGYHHVRSARNLIYKVIKIMRKHF